MKRRGPTVWLRLGEIVFVLALVIFAWAHVGYRSAETAYVYNLNHVVFSHGHNVTAALTQSAERVDRWLRLQIISGIVLGVAAVFIMVQIIRSRNQRMSHETAAAEAES